MSSGNEASVRAAAAACERVHRAGNWPSGIQSCVAGRILAHSGDTIVLANDNVFAGNGAR